jgi:hypothetical protein
MARKGGVWDRLVLDRAKARWADAARDALKCDLASLRSQRDHARGLRAHLDVLLHRAQERLQMPVGGDRTLPRPAGTDWAWRPELWRAAWPYSARAPLKTGTRIGTETTFFHDAGLAEIALRQAPNLRESDLAPYRLEIDVLGFDGGFLSVVLDLPQTAVDGLKRDHILRADLSLELEAPLEVFLRLNVQHGPNTEQMMLEAPRGQVEAVLEFDLAYSQLNEKRVEKAWLDLIFEAPAMNRIALRDITLSRRLRAAF